MRIDAHHQLWRYELEAFGWIVPGSVIARDFATEQLRLALDGAGLDAAIAVQARQSLEETRSMLDVARREPAILGVVGWIDLRALHIAALLDENTDPLVVGYRHVVQDEDDPEFLLADPFINGVRAVVVRGLTYDLLVNQAQLETVPHFLDKVGEGRFVFDHAAKPDIAGQSWQPWADRISAVAERRGVWCEVSGLETEADHTAWTPNDVERYLDQVLAVFGPERLIWRSDRPVCMLAASYDRVVDLAPDYVARRYPHAEADISGGNALRAFAIGGAR